MNSYIQKHKWQLTIFVILIIIAGVSGYYSFQDRIQNTDSRIQTKTKTQETTNNKTNSINDNNTTITTISKTPTTNVGDITLITTSTSVSDTASSTLTTASPVIPHPEPEWQNQITITINGEKYNLEYKENLSVYEMLQLLSADSKKSFIFTAKEYPGMGHFVESMNGVDNNNQSGKYWIYYINGESAKVGISNYIIQKEDKIEWKYEMSNI